MIKQIYRILRSTYGPQKWWPVTPSKKYHPEYTGGPESPKQQLEVIVGAILTQNTSWTNVEKAIFELHKKDCISVEKLRKTPQKQLAEYIRSSGYFNQKAIKLRAVADFLHVNPLSKLEKLSILELRELLLSVKGIGPETADSIILYAFNKAIFVVDAYTKRIFSRIGIVEKNVDYDTLQQLFHDNLRRDRRSFNEYHALIVEHGKNICKKTPLCTECALRKHCRQNY